MAGKRSPPTTSKELGGQPVDAQRSSAPEARSHKSKHCVLKWTMPSARQPDQPWRHSLPRLRCWPVLFRCRAVSWGRHGPCGHRAGAGLDLHRGGHCLAVPPTAGCRFPADFSHAANRGRKRALYPRWFPALAGCLQGIAEKRRGPAWPCAKRGLFVRCALFPPSALRPPVDDALGLAFRAGNGVRLQEAHPGGHAQKFLDALPEAALQGLQLPDFVGH